VHWRVFYTTPVDHLSFALSLHPPGSAGPASKKSARLHKLLFEHVSRSLRLAVRPPDLANTSGAVIILDNAGKVLTMSARAERVTCRGDGLSVQQLALVASTPEVTERLNSAIKSAVSSTVLGGAGGAVRLPRPSDRRDWLALISPSPRFLEHLPVRMPAAVLRLVDGKSHISLTKAHAGLFGLSPREAQVVQALIDGHSVESLSEELRISKNTARVHLQAVFRKTSTSRQAELMHLLTQLRQD
jgi:DNA-binding CsgD family transcriptional regulator